MQRLCVRFIQLTLLVVGFGSVPAEAGIITFTDRATFLAALSGPVAGDDYESHPLGPLTNGAALGDFVYTFDGSIVQPTIVPGGYGGQALGGPFDVFVGGDAVALSSGAPLRAFGADFYYGPSFEPVPGDIYRLSVNDGLGAGTFVGNLNGISADGGSFFLGVLADPAFEFSSVSLLSVVPVIDGEPYLVPAYQVDNLAYQTASPVPDGSPTLILSLIAAGGLMAARRRQARIDLNTN